MKKNDTTPEGEIVIQLTVAEAPFACVFGCTVSSAGPYSNRIKARKNGKQQNNKGM